MIQEQNTSSYDVLSTEFGRHKYFRSDEKNAVETYFPNNNAPILVVGCGGGRVPLHLHQLGYKNITAVDISPGMVAKAKEKLEPLGIKTIIADAVNLPFKDGEFAYVFFPFHGLDYVTERRKAIIEMKRVASDTVIFTSHNLLFPKSLKSYLKHRHDGHYIHLDEQGSELITYHTTMAEVFFLKKVFRKAKVRSRIAMQRLQNPNWKDRVILALPFIDKSLYFIGKK